MMRPGDWNCPNCNTHCFARRRTCFKCRTVKPGSENEAPVPYSSAPAETREGDWNCSKCNTHNFARRARCFDCQAPRPDVQAALDAGATPWICHCGADNFADRTSCYKCRSPKGADAPVAAEVVPTARRRRRNRRPRDLRAGDWLCSECGSHQFASRTECRDCGCPKNETDVVSQEDAMRPGDWLCPACGDHQFASRVVCRACGESRPEGTAPAPVKKVAPAPVAEDDEETWICSCDVENAASALVCKECGAEKVDF